MKKIRVLQVLDKVGYNSGVSAVVMNYCTNLSRDIVDIDFLLFEKPDKEWQLILEEMGAEIYVMGKPSGLQLMSYKRNVEVFFEKFGTLYDIVHLHVPNVAFIVLSCAKKKGIGTRIIHSHNSRGADGILKKMRNFILNKWGIYYANYYAACSKTAAEYLYGKRRIREKDIIYLNNAIELEKYKFNIDSRNKIREELEIGNDILLGHVGRFDEQKNHMGLLMIFAKLREQRWNGKLLLIGDGELKSSIIKQAESLGIKEDVIFAGVVSNVNEYMSAMDVFLLPSLYEGLPVVGIEAQASGLTCLISDRVSSEIKLTNCVQFIGLEDIERWCEYIKNAECCLEKRKNIEQKKLENFEIKKQAEILGKLYSSFV